MSKKPKKLFSEYNITNKDLSEVKLSEFDSIDGNKYINLTFIFRSNSNESIVSLVLTQNQLFQFKSIVNSFKQRKKEERNIQIPIV